MPQHHSPAVETNLNFFYDVWNVYIIYRKKLEYKKGILFDYSSFISAIPLKYVNKPGIQQLAFSCFGTGIKMGGGRKKGVGEKLCLFSFPNNIILSRT